LSKVYCTSPTSASGNHLNHASFMHSQKFTRSVDVKITGWLHKVTENQPAQYEFNRDLTLMVCRDLQPFCTVQRSGFSSFCKKNTGFDMPSELTILGTALVDIHMSMKQKVIELLATCVLERYFFLTQPMVLPT